MRRALRSSLLMLTFVETVRLIGAVPLGSEFHVNTYTTDYQYTGDVAALPGGGFVVVWRGPKGLDGLEVSGQRYTSSGLPAGSEFLVNSYTTSIQWRPSVAAFPAGFLVVWESFGQDGGSFGIFGQRFDTAGAALGSEFRVNTYTTGMQYRAAVAADGNGAFVVVWAGPDGSSSGIFAQRYASAGAALDPEFRVSTYTSFNQTSPAIASDAAGNFVVVWSDTGPHDGSSGGVFGQRYASSGAALGTEFLVNTYTTDFQHTPSVASAPGGDFVVVWNSVGQDGNLSGVFGQRFGSSGAALGAEFRVNTYTSNTQYSPRVSVDAGGDFVVTWYSRYQFGARPAERPIRRARSEGDRAPGPLGGVNFGLGVFAQLYSSAGAALGPEFQVNTYTTRGQADPRVAMDPAGNFLIVWESDTQDGSNSGIFGQRYCNDAAAPVVTPPGAATVTQTLCQ